MNISPKTITAAACIAMCLTAHAQDRLWYNKEASHWLEALPIGNSSMGAMIYGGTAEETIQINEETFWSGGPHNNYSEKSLPVLDEVRQLIINGREKEAEKIIGENFFTGINGMRFLPMVDLKLRFDLPDSCTNYERELVLSESINRTSFQCGNVKFTREVFASLPDKVIAIKLEASEKNALNFETLFTSPLEFTTSAQDNQLTAVVKGEDHEGIKSALDAECTLRIITKGKVETIGSADGAPARLKVHGAKQALIIISAATNFVNYHDVSASATERNEQRLKAVEKLTFADLYKRHIKEFGRQYNRVSLQLPEGANANLPTNERIAAFAGSDDMGLVTLLFNYGRYLLISSSQPGGQPANLQGVWNKEVKAPWDSKYTININTEMNYWPAEPLGLTEAAEPLFAMVRDLSETGKATARTMYNCRGWVAHHNTDLWRITGPVDYAGPGMFPNGGAWLTTHLWEHYLFTEDIDFLRQHFPVMKGAADFCMDYLYPMGDYLVTVPSVSPEHGPANKKTPITAGCTMDNQIVTDVFNAVIRASEILNLNNAQYTDSLKHCLAKLPPMKVGKHGQLQEWLHDADDPKNEHRHISHLYGLYPSAQITPIETPELFRAAKVTLTHRGDQATGWSLGWKINFWARMLDGNHAFRIISNMLTLLDDLDSNHKKTVHGRTYPNLFDAHPPFQIDGNFGATAAIAEMLVQSHSEAVFLLPALPDAWAKGGYIKGVRLRGNASIDLEWTDGELKDFSIRAQKGKQMRIRSLKPLKFASLANERKHMLDDGLTIYEYDYTAE